MAHTGQQAQCGSAQAKNALKSLAPTGTPIQLRALKGTSYDDYSGGRIVRSIYAQDEEGNWFDTARQLVSDGTVLWFPLSDTSDKKPEWAHNLEYRVLAEDARSQSRGLWTPNYCGPSPAANLRMSGLVGPGQLCDRLRGGLHRQRRRATSVSADGHFGIRLSTSTRSPGTRACLLARASRCGSRPARTTRHMASTTRAAERGSATCPRTTPRSPGDVAYLMDNAGPYETGNLRTWFPLPVQPRRLHGPAARQGRGPAPRWRQTGTPVRTCPAHLGRSMSAQRPTTRGTISIAWQAPTYVGDSVGHHGLPDQRDEVGGPALSPKTVGAAPPLTYTWTGLTAGKAYSFAVEAQNAQGWSSPSASSSPVTSRKRPRKPDCGSRLPGISRSPPGGPLRPPTTGQR